MRLQLEGQVEDLAAKLKDVDAENGRLKVSMRYWAHANCKIIRLDHECHALCTDTVSAHAAGAGGQSQEPVQ